METVPGAALLRGSGMRERHATTDTLREVIRGYNRSQLAREYPFFDHEFDRHLFLFDLGLKYLPAGVPFTVLDIGTGRGICPRFFSRLGHRSITLDFPVTGTNEALNAAAMAGVETH